MSKNITEKFSNASEVGLTTTQYVNTDQKLPSEFILAYITLNSASLLVNLIHLSIVARTRYTKTNGGEHYKIFLYAMGILSVILCFLRVLCSNNAAQRILYDYHFLCFLSAFLHHGCSLQLLILIFTISIDRLQAITDGQAYWQRFQVKHYWLVGLIITCAVILFYGIPATILYNDAYTLKGLGTCKTSSPTVPLDLASTAVGTLFMTLLGCVCVTFVCKLKKFQISNPTVYQRTRELNHMTGLLFIAQLACWAPVLIMLGLRVRKVSCPLCEMTGLFLYSMNPLVNPFIYGMTISRYRKLLLRLPCYDNSDANSSSFNNLSSGASVSFTNLADKVDKIGASMETVISKP